MPDFAYLYSVIAKPNIIIKTDLQSIFRNFFALLCKTNSSSPLLSLLAFDSLYKIISLFT